ncbi:MAG: hypothetical protein ACFFAZ_04100 [Promethearchaeota archaeon]
MKARAADWIRYHTSVHTSTHELAKIVSQSKPKRLVLNHQLFWSDSETELLQESKNRYDGIVASGNDLDVF